MGGAWRREVGVKGALWPFELLPELLGLGTISNEGLMVI